MRTPAEPRPRQSAPSSTAPIRSMPRPACPRTHVRRPPPQASLPEHGRARGRSTGHGRTGSKEAPTPPPCDPGRMPRASPTHRGLSPAPAMTRGCSLHEQISVRTRGMGGVPGQKPQPLKVLPPRGTKIRRNRTVHLAHPIQMLRLHRHERVQHLPRRLLCRGRPDVHQLAGIHDLRRRAERLGEPVIEHGRDHQRTTTGPVTPFSRGTSLSGYRNRKTGSGMSRPTS